MNYNNDDTNISNKKNNKKRKGADEMIKIHFINNCKQPNQTKHN